MDNYKTSLPYKKEYVQKSCEDLTPRATFLRFRELLKERVKQNERCRRFLLTIRSKCKGYFTDTTPAFMAYMARPVRVVMLSFLKRLSR